MRKPCFWNQKLKNWSCIILKSSKFLKEHPKTKIKDFHYIFMLIHCALLKYGTKNTYFWKMAWLLVKWTKDNINSCIHYEKNCLTFQISRWAWEIWVLHPQVSKQNNVSHMIRLEEDFNLSKVLKGPWD